MKFYKSMFLSSQASHKVDSSSWRTLYELGLKESEAIIKEKDLQAIYRYDSLNGKVCLTATSVRRNQCDIFSLNFQSYTCISRYVFIFAWVMNKHSKSMKLCLLFCVNVYTCMCLRVNEWKGLVEDLFFSSLNFDERPWTYNVWGEALFMSTQWSRRLQVWLPHHLFFVWWTWFKNKRTQNIRQSIQNPNAEVGQTTAPLIDILW